MAPPSAADAVVAICLRCVRVAAAADGRGWSGRGLKARRWGLEAGRKASRRPEACDEFVNNHAVSKGEIIDDYT